MGLGCPTVNVKGATPEANPYWGHPENPTLAMMASVFSRLEMVSVFEPLARPTYVLLNDKEAGLEETSCPIMVAAAAQSRRQKRIARIVLCVLEPIVTKSSN